MRTASSSYNTYNALAYKKPVFAVEFSGINTKFVSDVFADILSPPMGVTYKKYLKNVRFNQGELDIFTPSYISGTYVISIVDFNAEVTSFLNSEAVLGSTVTIKLGFQEINYADFANLTVAGAKVIDYYLNADLLTYDIECRDGLLELLNKNIGIANYPGLNTTLDGALASAGTSFFVISDSNFYEPTDLTNNLDDRIYTVVKINSEIIKYETLAGSNEVTDLTRPIGGTSSPSSHDSGSVVMQGLGFSCDPLRIFLHISMATTSGTNGKYDFDSNVNFSFGGTSFLNIGLTDSEIAVQNIERLGWKLFNYIEYHPAQCRFYFSGEAVNFLDHIQTNLFKPYGLFLMIRDGKIDVGSNDFLDFYENYSADDTFDSENIESINSIRHSDFKELSSSQLISYEYNHATGEFSDTYSIGTYGADTLASYPNLTNELAVYYYSLDSADGADLTLFEAWAKYRMTNFLDLSTIVNISSNHQTALLETGDNVTITLSNLPNVKTGSRGWTAVKSLFVGQSFDFLSGSFQHTLRVFDIPGFAGTAAGGAVGFYDINKVAEGSIDDTTLSVSADETATTEAADAYYDNSTSQYEADLYIFFIEVTQPNYGSGSTSEIINLKLSLLDSSPAIIQYDYKPYIYFNPQSDETFTVALYVYANADVFADSYIIDKAKVDWISTTATGSEIPTVAFTGIWFVKAA